MNIFCKKCNINWARLYSYDYDDESYEYCPCCGSDLDLVAGSRQADAFIKNPFSGHIINVRTNQVMQLKSDAEMPAQKLFAAEKQAKKKLAIQTKKMLEETAETAAIDAYLRHVERDTTHAQQTYFIMLQQAG